MKKIILLLALFCLSSTVVLAQTTPPPYPTPTPYKLLAPIPLDGSDSGVTTETTTAQYIPGLIKLVIALAGVLAVLRLIFAGIKYMSTDAFSGKSEAKSIIENALWGLFLAMSAWLILYTLNPKLVELDLNVTPQIISTSTPGTGGPPGPNTCTGCVVVTVPHKEAPTGCALPGPCVIQAGLLTRLENLDKITDFYVTEMYPPTRQHRASCHSNGSCVDATINSATEARIKRFIEDAAIVNLDAQFETTTEKRASDIRKATGLSTDKVYYVAGITGEHFSVYNK